MSALVLGVVMAVGLFLVRSTNETVAVGWSDQDVFFQTTKNAYVSWSWSASQPLDFSIVNPEGKTIRKLTKQTATEGKFLADTTGTYHFIFTKTTYEDTDVTYHISYIPGLLMIYLFVVGISLVVLLVADSIYNIIKKRKKGLPEQGPNVSQSSESMQPAPEQPPAPAPSPTMPHALSSRPVKPMVKGKTRYCTACGFENLDEARYCSGCGKPL
jgi:hypothetical protein